MFKIENEKLKPFLVLSLLQVAFACAVFYNELMSINNRVPGGNFPIEHKYSWARVFLFCGGAIISIVVIWVLVLKNPLDILFPPLITVLGVALMPTLMSVASGYDSLTGWCCDVLSARYFGFPFSYIMGKALLEFLQISI